MIGKYNDFISKVYEAKGNKIIKNENVNIDAEQLIKDIKSGKVKIEYKVPDVPDERYTYKLPDADRIIESIEDRIELTKEILEEKGLKYEDKPYTINKLHYSFYNLSTYTHPCCI
jgi:lipoate-protein ligase A